MANHIPQVNQLGTLKHSAPVKQKVRNSFKMPKLFDRFNLPLLVTVGVLATFGLIVCYSATSGNEEYAFSRQVMGLVIGLIACSFFFRFDHRFFARLTIPLLVISVILILSPHLPFIGVSAMGAKSWIRLGIQFQPGEFAKVTVILFAASLVARSGGQVASLKEYCKTVGLLAIPFVCILTQPDLGTGLVYLVISAIVLIAGGARWRYIIATILVVVGAFIAILIIDEVIKTQASDGTWEYKLLKNYQRSRLFVFMNQDSADTSSEAYNLQQAMIAIGRGGIFGKGLFASTQSSLGFLPEAPTDFIFCVLAEELGFMGSLFLIGLYAALLLITLYIGRNSSNLFGMLLCLGVSGMWLFQVIENIGMCCGVMPITGIPLPFVSYGSSFMIVNFACVGLVANVYRTSTDGGINAKSGKDVKYAKTQRH